MKRALSLLRRTMFRRPGALLLAATGWGCAPETPAGDEPDELPSRSAQEATSATLTVVDSLTEEGVDGRVLAGPGEEGAPPVFLGDVLYADPRTVVRALDPDATVEVRDGRLVLDGSETGLRVLEEDGLPRAQVAPLAALFGGYLHAEPSARVATLWPRGPLCALAGTSMAPGGALGSPVFLGAAREGLLGGCGLPVEPRVRELARAQPDDPWEANLLFDTLVADEAALSLLREYEVLPYAAFGWTRWEHRMGGAPQAASEAWLSALRVGAVRRARSILCDGGARPRGAAAVGEVPARGIPEARRRALLLRGEVLDRRHLADLEAAERVMRTVPGGAPILYALRVTGPARQLRRLALDPRVARLEPAVKVNDLPVLPEVDVPAAVREPWVPPDIQALSIAEVRARTPRVVEVACDDVGGME